MAPRKEKVEKASGDEAVDMVLTYLRKQNRPYSAIDISSNLHNKVTKTAAVKILKELHERKEIEGRAAGKQLIYHAIQANDDCSPEALAALDAQVSVVRNEVIELHSLVATLKSQLHTLSSEQSPSELKQSIEERSAEKAALTAKLEGFQSGAQKAVPEAERVRVQTALKNWTAIECRRRKIVKTLWGEIQEGLSMSGMGNVEELKEQFGMV